VTNENYDPEAPGFALWDQVHVFLKDSRVLESEQVRHALGNAKRPLGTDDLRRKFLDCMAAGDQGFDAEQLFRDRSAFSTAILRSVRLDPPMAERCETSTSRVRPTP